MEANLVWIGDMHFKSEARKISVNLDASPTHGGKNLGQTPKELVLSGLCGCTAMDVVSTLKKMRQGMTALKISAEANQTTEYPTHFDQIKLKFYVEGEVALEKLKQAVELSQTKYCGVSFMLSKVAKIEYEVFLNGKSEFSGKSQF